MGDWDGTVRCTITACDPPRLLSYTWVGGSTTNPQFGTALDSTLTWTLTPVEGGTHLVQLLRTYPNLNLYGYTARPRGTLIGMEVNAMNVAFGLRSMIRFSVASPCSCSALAWACRW